MNIICGISGIVFIIADIVFLTKEKKKVGEGLFPICALLSFMGDFVALLLVLDCLNIGSIIDMSFVFSKEAWFNFLGTYFATIITVVFSSYITITMTNKQIKINSMESYKPRLKLYDVKVIEKNNDISIYMLSGKNFNKDLPYHNCRLNIKLKNIGIGLAQNVEFYSLHNGEKCVRIQAINFEKMQKGFSTEEIEKGEEYEFNFNFAYMIKGKNSRIEKYDYALILCRYEDINGNPYEMLIGISVKSEIEDEEGNICPIIDSYYYQGGTENFNNMVTKNAINYEKIKNN